MKSAPPIRQKPLSRSRSESPDQAIARLEALVDEVVKDTPDEAKIRSCMEQAGMDYTSDPIERMNRVMSALDRIRDRARDGEKGI